MQEKSRNDRGACVKQATPKQCGFCVLGQGLSGDAEGPDADCKAPPRKQAIDVRMLSIKKNEYGQADKDQRADQIGECIKGNAQRIGIQHEISAFVIVRIAA